MGGISILFLVPIPISIIEIIAVLYSKISRTKFSGHSLIKLLLLLSALICWFPYTVMHGWTVGTFNIQSTILVSAVILYLFFTLNKLLHKNYQNIIKILISIGVLAFTTYHFVEIPPYGNYTSGHPFEDIILQDVRNYLLTFSVYTFTLLFFLIKLIKSQRK